MTKTVLLLAALTASSAAIAAPYDQGVCDGIRAMQKYPATTDVGIVVTKHTGKSSYFKCNGSNPGAVPPTDTVFVVRN